jgi:hypothetical protein
VKCRGVPCKHTVGQVRRRSALSRHDRLVISNTLFNLPPGSLSPRLSLLHQIEKRGFLGLPSLYFHIPCQIYCVAQRANISLSGQYVAI